ncbi:hypothetical protein [Chitinilyticum litopenaei]|uniref:hypothetical protein n=1 Tax=Chitinilyticum litopenaei TaxID=1121276 RepID=UPI0011864417|nr:hypothetical protein [Chitinilyticum litopenaei]
MQNSIKAISEAVLNTPPNTDWDKITVIAKIISRHCEFEGWATNKGNTKSTSVDFDATDLIEELREKMAADTGNAWYTMRIDINRNGEFDFFL